MFQRPTRWLPAGWLLLGLALALTAFPAAAQTTPTLDVRIERDVTPSWADDLTMNLRVTITEHATGQPPRDRYAVYALADNPSGEKTPINPCGQISDNDPQALPGVYACTVIVDHGGVWTFHGVVIQRRLNKNQLPVTLAQASAEFEIRTTAVVKTPTETKTAGNVVRGKAREVMVLGGHSAAAAAWFGCVAILAVMALPGTRRCLSTRVLHRLEERLDLIVKATWTVTGLTIGTGIYLLLKQTAYQTPFSSSKMHAVFALPYGKAYFLTLATKLVLYALMVLPSVSLAHEAERQRRLGSDTAVRAAQPAGGTSAARRVAGDRDSVWGSAPRAQGGGAIAATATKAPPREHLGGATPDQPRRATIVVRSAPLVVLAGGMGIWVCVTLLKYLHELVEAARVQ